MAYRTPETLGADRIAAAVAALPLGGGRPVVVVDAGTAVTVDAVDVRNGSAVYLGGAIAPGPDLLARALARGTGALPSVTFGGPVLTGRRLHRGSDPVGRGRLPVRRGRRLLVATTAESLAEPPVVVATGGVAAWLVAHGLPVDRLVPTLVLDGVRALATGAAEPRRRG